MTDYPEDEDTQNAAPVWAKLEQPGAPQLAPAIIHAKQATADKPDKQDTRTPQQWGEKFYGARPAESWKHDVAEQVHGWKQHAHQTGTAMQLTAADYKAAVAAATDPESKGPHAAALSPHSPRAKRAAAQEGAK